MDQGERRGRSGVPSRGGRVVASDKEIYTWKAIKGPDFVAKKTYTRIEGIRHMFAALDLATGQMYYRFRDRKRWSQFPDFCKQLRRRFSAGKLYLVCETYGHGKADVRAWCTDEDIEQAYMPTHASWLNWIECEFHRCQLLYPRRQRLPQPRRSGSRHRWLPR
ncbi:transposase [Amycolatopsis sp. NPDC049868]|uniref:transposase n=1 Tax=Amycolatopsis sp. NPDC049868 TaxID=3363934 RepID=UPI0037BDB484